MRRALLALTLLGILAPVQAASANPEDFGPYPVTVEHVRIPLPLDANGPEGALTSVNANVYIPQGTKKRPLVELGHAWPGTLKEFPLSGWGERLASNGFVVIVADRRAGSNLALTPELGQPADFIDLASPAVHSEDMLRILRWAIAQSKRPGSPLTGKVDSRRLAIGGHSLGGYFSTFAAVRAQSEGPRLSALLLLDPSDERLGPLTYQSSLPESPTVQIPTLVLASEENTHPIQCNMDDGPDCTLVAPQQYAQLTSARALYGVKVIGSVHEDIEDPSTIGTSESKANLLLFERYGIAWAKYFIARDCTMASWLGGAGALADVAAGKIALYPGARGLSSC